MIHLENSEEMLEKIWGRDRFIEKLLKIEFYLTILVTLTAASSQIIQVSNKDSVTFQLFKWYDEKYLQ